MEELEQMAAQTTVESQEAPETAVEIADATEDAASETQFQDQTDEAGEPEAQPAEPETTKSKEQNKAERAKFAEKRREAERIEQIKRQAKFEGLKEALNGKNPYTNESIEDEVDLQVYLDMKEIEKNGGDPVMDYAKYVVNKQKTAAKAAMSEADTREWFIKDRDSFFKEHPEFSGDKLRDLTENEAFNAFSEKMLGKIPLTEIYESYESLMTAVETEAKRKADRMYAKRISTPNSLGGTDYMPKKGIAQLSDAEFEAIYEKAIRGDYIK